MAWARIDDNFDDHPKVLAILDQEHGLAAIGLWSLCLTWAHRNTRKRGKVPGLLPASLPRRFGGPGVRDLISILVTPPDGFTEGLWEIDERGGWLIHDFHLYLPTGELSKKRSEAGSAGAAARWGNRVSAGRDGKLPSTDSNPDAIANSNPMANNGLSGQPADSPADVLFGAPEHGNLASADSKLPSDRSNAMASGSQPDGKPMAIPTPTPITTAPSGAVADDKRRPALTVTQRSKAITDAYAEAEPMCKWPAVNGIVIRAIKSERYADDEIRAALLRLAQEGRGVTVETLRTELSGFPPARSNGQRPPAATDKIASLQALKDNPPPATPPNVIQGSVL
jgi:hypothetical protein